MKTTKITAMFLAVFLLAGCLGTPTAQQMSRDNNIIIEVVNQSDVDITGLELEWTVDGKTVGGQGVAHADGSKLAKGESFLFELLENDLPQGTNVDLGFAVIGADGARQALQPSFALRAEFGQICRYELTGAQAQEMQVRALDGEESSRGQ